MGPCPPSHQKGKKMKRLIAVAVASLGLTLATPALACQFAWHEYGDSTPAIQKALESTVTDEWCAKFPKSKYSLSIISHNYIMQNGGVAGHAIVGVVKKGSSSVPLIRYSTLATDLEGSTVGDAVAVQVRAVKSSMENLMSDLDRIETSNIR